MKKPERARLLTMVARVRRVVVGDARAKRDQKRYDGAVQHGVDLVALDDAFTHLRRLAQTWNDSARIPIP